MDAVRHRRVPFLSLTALLCAATGSQRAVSLWWCSSPGCSLLSWVVVSFRSADSRHRCWSRTRRGPGQQVPLCDGGGARVHVLESCVLAHPPHRARRRLFSSRFLVLSGRVAVNAGVGSLVSASRCCRLGSTY
ncbi:hypothetical protein AMAG_19321 [Allomyces macrogynus ATCC 38327]|uniref:Secreted protein n=1 Tax=Allomyces macrogynus (strain ATCC 38327) TaxID=578462 RepID=A0A0L0SUN4_ALLM3|nr:hypothetical protein AMAG_19321 [Allomyces macrogynus ATCC 38327]|eukprot:KNE66039.1 hypothetical protein AMAG_19321 [Allomyces macrogynus ATCC 38327]